MSRKVMPCIVYARVVGYYRPVSAFNKGKTAEWNNRSLIQINVPQQTQTEETTTIA